MVAHSLHHRCTKYCTVNAHIYKRKDPTAPHLTNIHGGDNAQNLQHDADVATAREKYLNT
ncbi:MAG: hypothetical protein QXT27_06620 [Pyrobaculum sp.]